MACCMAAPHIRPSTSFCLSAVVVVERHICAAYMMEADQIRISIFLFPSVFISRLVPGSRMEDDSRVVWWAGGTKSFGFEAAV